MICTCLDSWHLNCGTGVLTTAYRKSRSNVNVDRVRQMSKRLIAERRKRQRMALHWAVRLRRPSSNDEVRAETENLTTEGFYCLSPKPFRRGEELSCVIDLPSSDASTPGRKLRGMVTVLRAKRVNAKVFGIACRLHNYSLIANSG